MSDAKPLRARPLIDRVMLIAAMACMAIALTRFALVIATVPYAAYVGWRAASEAAVAGLPAPTERLAERVAASGPFVSWWAGRDVPDREGGDYLGIISRRSTARTLGCVIGVLTARDRKDGDVIRRVLVPTDPTALYGAESGTLMTRADGTEYRSYWGPLSQDSAFFSDTPVVERDYDPILSEARAARLVATAGLVERSRAFFVGAPVPGGSGTWVLRVMTGKVRTYALVPLESSPIGGAL